MNALLLGEIIGAGSLCFVGWTYNRRKIKEAEALKPQACDHEWKVDEQFTDKTYNDIFPNYRTKIIYKSCKKCGESTKTVFRDRI